MIATIPAMEEGETAEVVSGCRTINFDYIGYFQKKRGQAKNNLVPLFSIRWREYYSFSAIDAGEVSTIASF
jgi:hypothetical protein